MTVRFAHNDGLVYKYKAFGLTIASELQLTELVETTAPEVDVTIKLGKTPDVIDNAIINKNNRSLGKDQFRLDKPGIARFYVEKGNRIILDPYEGALLEEVKLYLLGSCMGAILFQRGIMPLHGSCLQIAGQGTLLTGLTGAGKSTIAAALLEKGSSLITDDVAAVTFAENGDPIVHPSYPSQKLWEDALARMVQSTMAKSLTRVANDLSKYAVAKTESFTDQPVVLRKIYEIIAEDRNELQIESVDGTDKLEVVLRNTYRRFYAQGFDCKDWHFHYCVRIAGRVDVCRLRRPKDVPLEQEIAKLIIEQMS